MAYRVHKVTPSDLLGNPVGVTNGAQNVILQGESTVSPGTYIGVKVTPDGGICTNQNILIVDSNSSTANLAVGATFTGPAATNIYSSGIQVILTSDQNCTVIVEQSGDGTTWHIADTYDYWAAIGNFGITVLCFGAFFRVKVTNIGVATTTVFNLQSIIVPFVTSLPRSVDNQGLLKTAVNSIQDHNGFIQQLSTHGDILAVPEYRLVGGTFTGGTIDPNFWTQSLGTGGTIVTDGQITIHTGTTANNVVSIQSVRVARYTSGQSNKFRSVARIPDAGVANNTRRLGAFTTTDGAFFEINGTAFRLAVRHGGVTTYIENGTFNGHHGAWHVDDFPHTHAYEIRWTTRYVYFYLDDHLFHTHNAETAPWTDTEHLPVRFENFNTNGSTTDVLFEIRNGIISKLGIPQTQPTDALVQRAGTDITYVAKYGPGNLHGAILSGITNNSVVNLYDNTVASGHLIWTSGPLTANGLPFFLDFKGINFSTGLTVNLTGANVNVLVMYE